MKTYLQRIGRFEIVAFVTGFALMAFELVAARLLAPSIGSSIYIWTSVIGVMISALSAGYAIGGKLADMRVRASDIAWLLLLAALSVVAMSFLASRFLEVIMQILSDARLQGVVASLLLFAPTSFLLGVISPYLVRLRVSSTKTSGESVALLSALNSIGGIVGTFLTGFIFFSFVGTTQALVIIAGLLGGISWLVAPRTRWRHRLMLMTIIIILAIVSLFPVQQKNVVDTIDTPTATYQVRQAMMGDDEIRVLVMGPSGYQSGVYSDGRTDAVFFYTKKILQVIEQTPQKARILVLGGGAFTMPQTLATKYPHSQVDVVEIDPQLEAIAKRYFYYHSPANVRIIAEDARAFLNKNVNRYDIIVADVYSDIAIPFALTTAEYAQTVKRALQPQGSVVVNLVVGNNQACAPLFEGLHAAYSSVLPEAVFFPNFDASLQKRQNVIAVYGNDLQWLSHKGASRAQVAQSAPFTDSFAPVERLGMQCG